MADGTELAEPADETDAIPDLNLRVENLTRTFGDIVAVNNLDLEVRLGNLRSLLGPSGCGKTTTLRCIAGLERPDSGRIYIDDELVTDPDQGIHTPPENRGIGMVFQSYAVWPHMTVEENVKYPLKVQKIGSKAERNERVHAVLESVGLDANMDNLATNLSGGQQQRVAIARALVVEPDILLFDEPLSNLDAQLRREMRLEIRRIYKEFNTTVLYVTHSQDEAMFLSDSISLMNKGQIIEEGPPLELHADPKTFFGMNFMGRCNTLEGTVGELDIERNRIVVETDIGAVASTDLQGNFAVGDRAFVCFRPKFCQLLTDSDDRDPTTDTFDTVGSVVMQAATRDFTEYKLDVNGTEILVRTPDPIALSAGDELRFGIDAEAVKVFEYAPNRDVLDTDAITTAEMASEEETGIGADVPLTDA